MEKFKEILLLLGQGLVVIFKIAIKILMFLGEISSNISSNSSKKVTQKYTKRK